MSSEPRRHAVMLSLNLLVYGFLAPVTGGLAGRAAPGYGGCQKRTDVLTP